MHRQVQSQTLQNNCVSSLQSTLTETLIAALATNPPSEAQATSSTKS
jgi:hypothetical protein